MFYLRYFSIQTEQNPLPQSWNLPKKVLLIFKSWLALIQLYKKYIV